MIQKTLEKIEVRLVSRRPLSGNDEDIIRQRLWKTLEHQFEVDFTYHETLERSRSGKFEDFKSEVPPTDVATSVPDQAVSRFKSAMPDTVAVG